MAELRFFHGTKAQYDAVTKKNNSDFYVTHEEHEVGGEKKVWYSLWLGDNLLSHGHSYEMLVKEIEAREAADSAIAEALQEAVKELKAQIGQTSADKTYSIVATTEGLGENVKEAFKLVDGNGVQAGETIKIYKDSALKSVSLDGQELVFTYVLVDGSESVVRVDVSSFLHESEYGDGLQVIDHVVSVKRDEESDDFLSVSEKGIKVSGVRAAIDAAIARAQEAETALQNALDAEKKAREDADAAEKAAREEAVKSLNEALEAEKAAREEASNAMNEALKAELKAESDRAKEAEAALADALNAEVAAREAAVEALNSSIAAEAKAREEAVKAEEDARKAADEKLAADLAAEADRAKAAEAAEEARALAAEALLRANSVINVKPAAHSAVHVSIEASEKGKIATVGMAWMNIAYEAASEGDLNAAFASNEPEIRLVGDVTLSAPVHAKGLVNLNDQVLTNKVGNAQTDVVLVDKNDTLKIEGNGKVVAVSGNDGYPMIADGTVEIYGGYFESGYDANGQANACIYVRGNGKVYIYGGEFHSPDGSFVLNKKDADRATAEIHVMGGRFYNFNPADNASEGAHTNFVAEGYVSVEVEPNVWEVMLKA